MECPGPPGSSHKRKQEVLDAKECSFGIIFLLWASKGWETFAYLMCPKHLLRQILLWREHLTSHPPRGKMSISSRWLHSRQMKERLERKQLTQLEERFLTFPRRGRSALMYWFCDCRVQDRHRINNSKRALLHNFLTKIILSGLNH